MIFIFGHIEVVIIKLMTEDTQMGHKRNLLRLLSNPFFTPQTEIYFNVI